jgi:predicted sulfurtransferase
VISDRKQLASVIHLLHGGHATYRESVPVKETWQGKTVWDGIVEVFDLRGHPEANTAYAWSHETDDPKNPQRHVAVLHIPPVVSPVTAVRAALLQEHRNAQA